MTMTPKTCANDCHVSLQHRTNNTVTDHDTNMAVSICQHFFSSVLLSKSRAHYYPKTKRLGSGAMGKYDLYHKAFLELAKDGCFQNKWLSDEYRPTMLILTMVLTAAQVAAFFEDADQMAIPHDTVIQLQTEGIVNPDDLTDFNKTSLKEVAENLCKPSDHIPNPDPAAPAGSTIPRPAYVFSAKSQKRLDEACELFLWHD